MVRAMSMLEEEAFSSGTTAARVSEKSVKVTKSDKSFPLLSGELVKR